MVCGVSIIAGRFRHLYVYFLDRYTALPDLIRGTMALAPPLDRYRLCFWRVEAARRLALACFLRLCWAWFAWCWATGGGYCRCCSACSCWEWGPNMSVSRSSHRLFRSTHNLARLPWLARS